jgi:hypothetical protein
MVDCQDRSTQPFEVVLYVSVQRYRVRQYLTNLGFGFVAGYFLARQRRKAPGLPPKVPLS